MAGNWVTGLEVSSKYVSLKNYVINLKSRLRVSDFTVLLVDVVIELAKVDRTFY